MSQPREEVVGLQQLFHGSKPRKLARIGRKSCELLGNLGTLFSQQPCGSLYATYFETGWAADFARPHDYRVGTLRDSVSDCQTVDSAHRRETN